jgi:hypothetical protein
VVSGGQLRNTLNAGLLPKGYSAVLAVQSRIAASRSEPAGGAVMTAVLPKVRYTIRAQSSMAARANRITIRHSLGRVVCVIEIVSPGNKHSITALRSFVEKSVDFLDNGVNLLIVDLFPPSARDPQGIHKAIWDEIEDSPFEFDANQPLTLVAYVAGLPKTAHVEPIAVGELMPDMPAYLDEDHYVPVPLEATYMEAWKSCPEDMREVVEKGQSSKS